MKRIGIYFFCVVAIGCVTSSFLYRESEKSNEIRLEKTTQEEELKTEQNIAVTASDSNQRNEERFFVIEEEGYLVVYDRLTMTRYDETTILVQDLPKRLQERAVSGFYFGTEAELYAFLENYSS